MSDLNPGASSFAFSASASSWEPEKPSEEPESVVDVVHEEHEVHEEPSEEPADSAEPDVVCEKDESKEMTRRPLSQDAFSALKPHDEREHVNIVFIGHVDSGKSTISGQILLLTGRVDERTIAKYEREAKDKNRDSWYLAFIMDTNEEERAKGKTVEVGRAHFATKRKRYTLLDAPGHKSYVPNMISGAAQADVGILIISARKGEFETGFDRGGQTREHALLAKTLGVQRLVVAVNKMDESTVKWSEKRFNQIVKKLIPFLRGCGYDTKRNVVFLPISGYTGANIQDAVSKDVCPWLKDRRSLLQVLDDLKPLKRDDSASLRIPVIDRYKDMGNLYLLGKIESGTLYKGLQLTLQPGSKLVECAGILVDDVDVDLARPGENVAVAIKGIDEGDVRGGFVLSPKGESCTMARSFIAQLVIVETLEHKPVITAGYQAILHVHSLIIGCEVTKLISEIDRKTGKRKPRRPMFAKKGSVVNARVSIPSPICVELYKNFAQLGRFTLRDESKTIAIGKVMKLDPLGDDSDSKANK